MQKMFTHMQKYLNGGQSYSNTKTLSNITNKAKLGQKNCEVLAK